MARRPISANELLVDPISLVLSHDIYVRLTLPDPPPPGVLRSIGETVKSLNDREKQAARAGVNNLAAYVKAFQEALG